MQTLNYVPLRKGRENFQSVVDEHRKKNSGNYIDR